MRRDEMRGGRWESARKHLKKERKKERKAWEHTDTYRARNISKHSFSNPGNPGKAKQRWNGTGSLVWRVVSHRITVSGLMMGGGKGHARNGSGFS